MTRGMKKIGAVFGKQLKDTLKNKMVLVQFILFPILGFVFTEGIAKSQPDIANNYFIILFATIYAGMVPMVNMATIISEEKEQSTLKVLMMSNVKPYEYLLGIGSYVFLFCTLGSFAFAMFGGYAGIEFIRFMIAMMLGVLASLLLGGAIGILSKNQMSATSVALPIAMIAAFLPMISSFNSSFEKISRFLYTQQINYLMQNVEHSSINLQNISIIGANFLVFIIIFMIAYRKQGTSR